MLYKFKSKTTGDLIMLEPNGRRVLEIIGKTPDAKGILFAVQMPAAIVRLEAAIAQEQADRRAAFASGEGEKVDGDANTALSLRQRARPFIDMLKRCSEAGSDIVWGV
jgi:hypothetical protein